MAKNQRDNDPSTDEDHGSDAYEQLSALHDLSPYEDSLIAMWQAQQQCALAIEGMAMDLKEVAKQERTELRQEILERARAINGPQATASTSKNILTCSARLGGLELFWAEIWYLGQDTKPRFNRIPNRNSGPDLRVLTNGAHPDEVAMITSHEMRAREIRFLWREHIGIKASIRVAIRRALKERRRQEDAETAT